MLNHRRSGRCRACGLSNARRLWHLYDFFRAVCVPKTTISTVSFCKHFRRASNTFSSFLPGALRCLPRGLGCLPLHRHRLRPFSLPARRTARATMTAQLLPVTAIVRDHRRLRRDGLLHDSERSQAPAMAVVTNLNAVAAIVRSA